MIAGRAPRVRAEHPEISRFGLTTVGRSFTVTPLQSIYIAKQHWGLLAGPCIIELVNVSTGLPFFPTTIAGTPLQLPFSMQFRARSLALHQPRLIWPKEELDQAYKAGNKLAVQCVALKKARRVMTRA